MTALRAEGAGGREPGAVGNQLFTDVEVSCGPEPVIVRSGSYRLLAGVRSDPWYPNGRTLTDHVVAARRAFLSNGTAADDRLKPNPDLQDQFPYLGTPHREPEAIPSYGAEHGW